MSPEPPLAHHVPFVAQQPHLIYLVVALTFGAEPLAPCLLVIPPLDWFAALFAFSAFFLLSALAFFSLASLIAAVRAA